MSYYLLCAEDVASLTIEKEVEERWPAPLYGPFETIARARIERAEIEQEKEHFPSCRGPHYIVHARKEIA